MENFYIEGSKGIYFIPTVNFNADTGVCELSGESYLEETIKFYTPLIQWLERYFEEVGKPLTFNFKLTYFNTSSSKCIVDILNLLKKYKDKGYDVTVNWYYDDSVEDIEDELEEVEDFMLETGLDINLIPMSKDKDKDSKEKE